MYPAELFFCYAHMNHDMCYEVLPSYSYNKAWGKLTDICISTLDSSEIPQMMDLVWLSICEKRFYSIERRTCMGKIKSVVANDFNNYTMLIGLAPYGGFALWLYSEKKSILMDWVIGQEVEVDMADFLPENPKRKLSEYCDFRMYDAIHVKENLEKNGLPTRNLFDKYMQQFNYRYLFLFEKWEEGKGRWQKYGDEEMAPEFGYVEEALFDGTHDKLHDGSLMKYHQAGKPEKLAVEWHIGKSEYSAYFWFEDERIREVFDRFYGAHPDTKTDFIIRIDAEKRKYELALYRYGLKEPQVISEDVYQQIVFKNKFEDYRSENYNQERGAWIW